MNQDPASQLFPPYLSAWIRERIGTPELQPGTVHPCEATILYADVSGFTRLTAAFTCTPDGAERLHDALNRCYSTLIETIDAYGGDVAAIAGDALTAWWPDQIDLELARRCGVAMLAALDTLPPLLTPAGPFRLELRIGISAGRVYAALAGLPSHGLHFVLCGPAIGAAASAERDSHNGAIKIVGPVPAPDPPVPATLLPPDPPTLLRWEHFLPPSFAERLRLNGLVGEYRRCVPVFAAFDLPQRPEELHPLVAQVQAVVLRWGGWLNEIEVGDKGALFVLLFGAPLARGDDSSRAVGCCLELHERGLITRAGITLGILFVGAVGSPQRRVYTAQGDDMNLAVHLMQLAPSGATLVSGRVRNDVLGRYVTSEPTFVVTKGHAEGVPVATVIPVARADRAGPAHRRRRIGTGTLPGVTSVVGRTAERQLMAVAAEAAATTGPALIVLEGESGIGKSCLLRELFVSWVEQGRPAYSAECSSGGATMPLLAWRPILLDICGINEGDPATLQQDQFEQVFRRVPSHLHAAAPDLGRVLGLGGARPAPPLSTDGAEQARLLALAAALVRLQTGHEPLLIVLEDIHWADTASLDLLVELLRTGPRRLCLALSHRPLDGPPRPPLAALREHPACTRLTVSRLSGTESVTLIREQLGVATVDAELLHHIERHTEGQPLFIKEYLRVLRQHQLITIEEEHARLTKVFTGAQVSNSAQGIIQARVDRLDEATRLTLKVAAVLGRSFQLQVLRSVHPAHPSAGVLDEQLATLMALQIIDLELEGPERVYRFKHGITHEVAYTSLLFGQRRQLHTAVARWYEARYGAELAVGVAPAVYDLLINHLGHAEEWERQADYCHRAAEQAARRFSTGAALRYIEQALIVTREPARRFRLLLLRIAINERAGNQGTQAEDQAQLEALAATLNDPLPRVYAGYFRLRLLLIADMEERLLRVAPALIRYLHRYQAHAATPAQAAELALLEAACLETVGTARAALGSPAAGRVLRLALTACGALPPTGEGRQASPTLLDPQSLAARCHDGLGSLELAAGRVEPALAHHRQALQLARAAGDWSAEARARERIGRVQLARGDLSAAAEEVRAALNTSNAVGDRGGQATALRQLASISAARGDYAHAESYAHNAVVISAAARARTLEAQLWEDLATYAAAQGLADESAAARREAVRVQRQWWGTLATTGLAH